MEQANAQVEAEPRDKALYPILYIILSIRIYMTAVC